MDSAVILPVNESFTDQRAIQILQHASCQHQKKKCGIYINYTMIHPGVSYKFYSKKHFKLFGLGGCK